MHMIGNAHIDPVWLWDWTEGFHEVVASFRSALDRLDESDDFTFVSSSAVFYAWIERHDPAMFERIKERIEEGRWEIVGGWWLQPDCNIPSGESFVRQALYGQRYFLEKFGHMAKVGYNVDSFGHTAMLPQLLRKSGLDAYVFMRPAPHELGLPSRLFWWESPDGSRVLTYRLPFEYCTWGEELDKHVRRCAGELRDPVDEIMCFYGVGNHGGGPTRQNIESIRRLNEDPDLPDLTFSTPDRYFAAVRERGWDLPVVHHDLQHHASGCYAAHSGVKAWNRRAESALVMAETFGALAASQTGREPTEDLAHAWHGVLFNQFHDILAGTSLRSAYDDAHDLYGEALAIGSRALNDAVMALAWRVDTPFEEGAKPVLALNPHAWPTTVPIELESWRLKDGEVLVDDGGNRVPLQAVQSEATANGRSRLLFMAELPALGYRSYRVVKGAGRADEAADEATGGAEPAEATSAAKSASGERELAAPAEGRRTLENARLRLEIDEQTGFLVSLFDKEAGVEALAGPAARPVVIDDPSDTWGHNVFRFDKVAGEFTATSVERVEDGDVRATLRVKSAYNSSTLIQDFSLYRDSDLIEVRARLDWREPNMALKLRFPVNVHFMRATYDVPYGFVERFANGEEEPGGSWIDVSGTARTNGDLYGLSVINDSRYSFDVNVRDIGMTVLRNPVYAHHDPAKLDPAATYDYTDAGLQRFRYALLPHRRGWAEAGTVRHAAEFNERPFAINTTFHDGPLPPAASFASVDNDAVVVTVMKRAEDGGATVLRARETTGNRAGATFELSGWNRRFEAEFGPLEIKTFLIPDDPAEEVRETDLLEFPLDAAAASGR
ncbi:MAG TPA: glycoside hydrolase family 38 C-terminal domain-containing protein [Trueperaceae bacterium]|nr:glycoside hydrolase family 38 C-terminal domain-containing protein [Trueperaceae bacterium]